MWRLFITRKGNPSLNAIITHGAILNPLISDPSTTSFIINIMTIL